MSLLPHDKASLLAYIQTLPDDIQIGPYEMNCQDGGDVQIRAGRWGASDGYDPFYGGRYERKVENMLRFTVRFTTRDEGWFKRTPEDPDGSFRKIHRM